MLGPLLATFWGPVQMNGQFDFVKATGLRVTLTWGNSGMRGNCARRVNIVIHQYIWIERQLAVRPFDPVRNFEGG